MPEVILILKEEERVMKSIPEIAILIRGRGA
jgi:hypothetical protein